MNDFYKLHSTLRTAAASLLIPCAGFLSAIGMVLTKPETAHLEFRPLPPVAIEVPEGNLDFSENDTE